MSLTLSSTAFIHEGPIPPRYTCDAEDVSPALSWTDVPEGTASLALIVDDPDAPDPAAPKMTWVHWVLCNLPPDTDGLNEAVTAGALPPGTLEGMTDFGKTGWGGPCPPIGRHRYFFKLFALDCVLPDLPELTSATLQAAMEGHVIAATQLMGTYIR
jgi:Raf kinase inhibitor-like YbhB/YbcL family protein